jgi:enoyl-CoA hydratase/carnithine racemase
MTTVSSESVVRVTRCGPVQWVTFNRPTVGNAIDDGLANGLVDALRSAANNAEIGAVVLTGAGERVFCASVDLKNPNGLSRDDLGESRRLRVMRSLDAVVQFEKPLVGALNGAAVGADGMLALLTDMVVATPTASLIFSEVDVGMPTFLALEIISRVAGEQIALDLVLSGRRMPADEAVRRGLYRELIESDHLQAQAQALAEQLAAKPPVAYALNKRWVNDQRRAVLQRASAESHRVRPLLHAGQPAETRMSARYSKSS